MQPSERELKKIKIKTMKKTQRCQRFIPSGLQSGPRDLPGIVALTFGELIGQEAIISIPVDL